MFSFIYMFILFDIIYLFIYLLKQTLPETVPSRTMGHLQESQFLCDMFPPLTLFQ